MFPAQHLSFHPGFGKGGPDHGQIHRFLFQGVQQLVGVPFVQLDGNLRVLLGEIPGTPEKPFSGAGRDHPQMETAFFSQLEILHVLLGRKGQGLDPFGRVIEAFPRFRETDLPSAPFQQPYPALGFQPLELEGHRGLGQVQPPGPCRYGPFFHHCNETVQLFQVHNASSYIENIWFSIDSISII